MPRLYIGFGGFSRGKVIWSFLIMQWTILVDLWIVPNEHDRARAAARFMIASLRFTMKI